MVGVMLAALGSGGSVVCSPGFSALDIFLAAHVSAHMVFGRPDTPPSHPGARPPHPYRGRQVPITFHSLLLRFAAAYVMAELEQVFGVPVIEAYGMTEAAHQMTSNPLPPGVRKPGSVGPPAGLEIAILSECATFLSMGEVDEVVIRGPNVMTGYRQNPEENRQAFTQGWFRTGDQGYLDRDGYLFLTGRLKELINRGGEKISPVEIDQALLGHPAVQQTVTFAVPHPTLGEEVPAAVVLHPHATVTESDLRQWLFSRLAEFKVPRRILFMDDIPKGPTGKIQRRGLSEQLSELLVSASENPSEPIHIFLLEIFQNILKLDHLGIDDNYFIVGGDSLRAVQIANRIRDIFPLALDAVTIFEHPTVRILGQHITDRLGSETVAGHLDSLS